MKKYISILILASVLGMLSCDRETSRNETSDDTIKRFQNRSNQNKTEPGTDTAGKVAPTSKETGDDDEPEDDKQHWKFPNDSISN